MENINDLRPEFTSPSEQGLTLNISENVDYPNLFTIVGLDEEFSEELELEISNPEQNKNFTVTKTDYSSTDGVTSWQLGVTGL